MPASHHSIFNKPDALPAAQPTVSKHGKQQITHLRHMTKLCFKTANKITFFMAPQLLHIIANKCFLVILLPRKKYNSYEYITELQKQLPTTNTYRVDIFTGVEAATVNLNRQKLANVMYHKTSKPHYTLPFFAA